jgi:hypothetical protein
MLYKAKNFDEAATVADVFVTDVGKIERLDDVCVRITLCSKGHLGGEQVLTPGVALVGSIATLRKVLAVVDQQLAVPNVVGLDQFVGLSARRGH